MALLGYKQLKFQTTRLAKVSAHESIPSEKCMQNARSKYSRRPDWQALYVAALFDTEPGKLCEHIAQAEAAILQRERELQTLSGDHIEEQQYLDDAMYTLGALRKTVEMNRNMRVTRNEWEQTGT